MKKSALNRNVSPSQPLSFAEVVEKSVSGSGTVVLPDKETVCAPYDLRHQLPRPGFRALPDVPFSTKPPVTEKPAPSSPKALQWVPGRTVALKTLRMPQAFRFSSDRASRQPTLHLTWQQLQKELEDTPARFSLTVLAKSAMEMLLPPGPSLPISPTPGVLEALASNLPAVLEARQKSDPKEINVANILVIIKLLKHYRDPVAASDKSTGALVQGMMRWVQHPAISSDPLWISKLLNHCHYLRPVPETAALVEAVVEHIGRVDPSPKNFSPSKLCDALYGMHHVPESVQTSNVVLALMPHLKALQGAQNFTGRDLAGAFVGIRHLGEHVDANAMRIELAAHIKDVKSLSAHDVFNLLAGVQYLQKSPARNAVLKALRSRLDTVENLPFDQISHDRSWGTHYFLEIVHSLENHFDHSETMALVRRLTEIVNVQHKPTTRNLQTSAARGRWIKEGFFPSENLSKGMHSLYSRLDLHGLSHSLAKEISSVAIKNFQRQLHSKELLIIYGRSTHRSANAQKMREAVEQAVEVIRATQALTVKTNWEKDGEVIFSKEHVKKK